MVRGAAAATSAATVPKLDEIAKIASVALRCAQAIAQATSWAHPRLLVFDLHGGPGGYSFDEGYRDGSPLILLRLLETLRMPYDLWVFERDAAMLGSLEARLGRVVPKVGTVRLIRGDNIETTVQVAAELQHMVSRPAFGMVLADPNGTRFDPHPMRTLLEALPENRVDGLVHVSATAYKRANGRYASTHGQRDLGDDLAAVGKPVTLIKKTPIYRPQFTFAILTRWQDFPRFKDYRRLGTPEGDGALERLMSTEAQWHDRMQLPLNLPSNDPIAPTPSTCDIPAFVPSAPSSLHGQAAAASAADGDHPATPTICDIPAGERSTCPRT